MHTPKLKEPTQSSELDANTEAGTFACPCGADVSKVRCSFSDLTPERLQIRTERLWSSAKIARAGCISGIYTRYLCASADSSLLCRCMGYAEQRTFCVLYASLMIFRYHSSEDRRLPAASYSCIPCRLKGDEKFELIKDSFQDILSAWTDLACFRCVIT